MSQLDDLKQEATELGITFNKNIGEAKLQEKVEAFYASQETSGAEIEALVAKQEEAETKAKAEAPKQDSAMAKRIEREKAARKTRIITIIDNDQRVNNHTTTCTATCANEFFDLGTKILPLNEKIEVSQGHINVLKTVFIPLHMRDNKTGLSSVRMRPRYTISYEDVE